MGQKFESASEFAKIFDHTILKAIATEEEVKKLCEEAKEYGFGAVCVNPTHVKFAAGQLAGTEVEVCTVIGFPLGATLTEVKAYETGESVTQGATEIDMVINLGELKGKKYQDVQSDIEGVVKAARGDTVKVILETCYLSDEEIIQACKLAKGAGANFVKTSTGFGTGGATAAHVKLMKETVGDELEVKASGGIRSLKDALAMVEAGATRIGASSSVAIVEEFKAQQKT